MKNESKLMLDIFTRLTPSFDYPEWFIREENRKITVPYEQREKEKDLELQISRSVPPCSTCFGLRCKHMTDQK